MNKETSIIKRNAKDSMIQIRHIQIICGILKIRNRNCINQVTFYHEYCTKDFYYIWFDYIRTIYGFLN